MAIDIKNMRYERIVSTGIYCQPAWQIRRFTGVVTPSYFDWTESPHRGLVMMIENRFQGFFRKERLSITDDKKAVRDLDTGIVYHHHFNPGPTHVAITEEILNQGYERQRAILDLLGKFWIHGAQTSRSLFVRQGCSSRDEALELYHVLKAQPGTMQCGLLLVCAPGRNIEIDHCSVHIEEGTEDVKSADEWTGDDTIWNRILRKYWCASPR